MKNPNTPAIVQQSIARLILFILLSFILNISIDAQVYVNHAATGSNNGTSWANAYTNLKTAIASTSSGEIWVAQGDYYPTSTNNPAESFNLKNSVSVYGGFNGTEISLTDRNFSLNVTSLNGNSGSISAEHVVSNTNGQNSTSVLDGFTVKNGSADLSGFGAGMYNVGASPTIKNCNFTSNAALASPDSAGGAIYNTSNSSPDISNCSFTFNDAYIGGAINNNSNSNPSIRNCTFRNNYSDEGAGVYNSTSSPLIENCVFLSNFATNNGGAITNFTSSNPLIINCTLFNNSADIAGGAISNFDNANTPTVKNCIILNNFTGSPLYTSINNYSSPGAPSSSISISHSIILDTSLPSPGYPCTNCITTATSVFITSSDPDGADNILGNDDDGINLINGSLAINAGTNVSAPLTDILDNDRIGTPDIGAYEAECQANLIYVNSSATGNNSGISWDNGMTDLQSALDLVAECSVDTILVAQGTYYPSSSPDNISTDTRDKSFHIANDVVIIGGYDPVTGTQTGAPTILSGANEDNYHVMVNTGLTSATVFEGLTFSNGNANGSGANDISYGGTAFDRQYGGGVYNKSSDPTYLSCSFTDNQAVLNGGGLYLTSSSATVNDCIFISNAANNGGGIGHAHSSSSAISTSIFDSNIANSSGGGVANIISSQATITNNVFVDNSAVNGGGIANSGSSTDIINCTLTGNTASNSAGSIHASTTTNITNTVSWGNGDEISGPSATVSNSIVEGGFAGCISCPNTDGNVDPDFVNIANFTGVDNTIRTIDDGLNLLGSSAAIDAGTSTAAPNTDFKGSPRIGNPDIGAYEAEFQPTNIQNVLKFDGVDDYVSWNTTFGASADYTVEAWVRFDSNPAGQNILVMSNGSGPDAFCDLQLKVDNDGYLAHTFQQFNSGSYDYKEVKNTTKIRPHVWYYVALFKNGSQVGVTVNENTASYGNYNSYNSGVSEVFLGKYACGTNAFDGEIEELRIWSKSINTRDQETLENSDPDLVHYFKFNEGIAGQNNSDLTVNTMTDPYNGDIATLHNFALDGTESNWMSCGPFDFTDSEFIIYTPVEQVIGDDMLLTSSIPGASPSSTYQWYKDGLPISGDATTDVETPTLSISNVQPSDAGNYYFGQTLDGICTIFSEHKDLIVRGTGEVLNFDGENDHVILETNPFTDQFTIELWVKFEDEVALQNIITGSDSNGPNAASYNQLYTDESGHLVLFIVDNESQQYKVVSDNAFLPNKWYHIAARSPMSLLIDGVLNSNQPSSPTELNSNMDFFYVGSEATSLDNSGHISLSPFKGEMEELRIWNDWRSTSSIQANKDTEINTTTSNRQHYFRFNQGLANGNNLNPAITNLPDYSDVSNPKLNVAELIGFSLEGDNSNWSDCSPITNAILNYSLEYQPLIGQDLELDLYVERGDTSELTFQWQFDGNPIVGETSPLYGKENLTTDDFGLYEVIVTDFCDPPFIDTVEVVNLQDIFCYTELPHQNIIHELTPTIVSIKFDNYPEHISWLITNSSGGTVASEGPYSNITPNSTIEIEINLLPGCYDFIINDSNGDGLTSPANYTVYANGTDVASGGGDFGFQDSETTNFCVLEPRTRYYGCVGIESSTVCDSISNEDLIYSNLSGSYCGGAQKYEGAENFYKITLSEPKVLDLTLSNITAGVDIFVFNDNCDVSTCLGSSTTDAPVEKLQVAVPAGDYYIIVDSRTQISTGASNIILDVIIYDTKCHFSTPITCGEELSGNTTDGVGFLSDYCDNTGYTGTEQVYEVVLNEAQTLFLELTNLSADLDLFLMDSTCSESICLKSSSLDENLDETITYGATAGTYYIVIDGKGGVNGTFDLSINCQDYFSASENETDAYIDLNWAIDKQLCVPQDTGVLVKLVDQFNNTLYEEEYTTAALTPDVITGTYRHIVGDDHTRIYVLRVYNRLSNVKICEDFKTGSTLPFQEPELISISEINSADSIQVVWRNHSQLSEEFRIYRDGVQFASMSEGYTEDSLIVAYVDLHEISDISSIDAASTYNYCIETYNNTLDQAYPQLCADGSTADIGFMASDGNPSDIISLTWNDISDYSDGIKISRNGIQLQVLSPTEIFYNDLSPIYGTVSEYSLTILRDGDEIIIVSDNGYIAANGSISGRVQTAEGGYPVHETIVALYKDSLIQGVSTEILVSETSTNYEGQFIFEDLYYGLAEEFKIIANKNGSIFNPESIDVELNGAIPQVNGLLFEDVSDVISQVTSTLLDTFYAEVLDAEDLVVLHWEYPTTGSDTTFFTMKRDGVLIFEGNDSSMEIDSFIDLTGVPGYDYTYTLEAFQYGNGLIKTAVRTQEADYPELTPVGGLDYQLGAINATPNVQSFDPRILFDWSSANHPSLNFDGYRVYRNNILVGEISFDASNNYEYLSVPGIEAGYSIRTYKKIDGASYESAQYPIQDILITSNNLWIPQMSSTPSSDRALIIDNTVYSSGFYNEAIYDGITIERKVSGSDDSTYINIGVLTKVNIGALANIASEPQIWDTYGIPNSTYTFKVSTFSDVGEDRYLESIIFDRVCPIIEGPSNIMKTEEVGKVNLTWEDNSRITGPQNQQYINYTGYELTRRDISNNGPEDIIATFPAASHDYQDYISNPVYSPFFDDYISTDFEYGLRGYLDIEGTRYYSASLDINAKPLDGSTSEPLPTEFVGSHNIPGHIKLCWSWEAAKLSEFVIYRGLEAIDTMPATARAYYDYNAPTNPSIEYRIASLHNGNLSEFVLTDGSMPSSVSISGRISNFYSGVGIEAANIAYENVADSGLGVTPGQYNGFTTSDATGNYYLENIPNIAGLELVISASGNNVDFDVTSVYQTSISSTLVLSQDEANSVDFVEYTEMSSTEGVSPIAAVTAVPNPIDMNVVINWSPENGNYDGFQIYRANSLIGEIKKGEGFKWIDQGGFPGIQYIWTVKAYQNGVSGREYSQPTSAVGVYPTILPVENMTVTAFAEMNKMRVSWSHPLDTHDSYRVRRNGQFMTSVPTGEILMWYDSTGIPGITYQYEVTAIKGANISDPVVVTKVYKGVGEVSNLTATIDNTIEACSENLTNDNHVNLSWEYQEGAANGFEIFRDEELIADISGSALLFGDTPLTPGDILVNGNNAYYNDYSGKPEALHEYYVLAYVIREGGRYTSGIEELIPTESIMYPVIASVLNLQVAQNNIFGSGQIKFDYESDIVSGFEVLRNGIILDTLLNNDEGSYAYQDYSGVPGSVYEYTARAFAKRSGVSYYGTTPCTESITFPTVPVPQNLTASQGTFQNHVEVTWDYSLIATVDSFYLENITKNETISFASGSRKYLDVIQNLDFDKYTYRVKASKIAEGVEIFSEWSDTTEGWSQSQLNSDQNEILDPGFGFTELGYLSTIDSDWAATMGRLIDGNGAFSGESMINIYKRSNGGWSFFQQIGVGLLPCWDAPGCTTPRMVLSDGKLAVRGTEGNVLIYTFNGVDWGYPNVISKPGYNLGDDIDLDGNQLIVSDADTDTGTIFIYDYTNNGWSEIYSSNKVGTSFFGRQVSIDNDMACILFYDNSEMQYNVRLIRKVNGTWGNISNDDQNKNIPPELKGFIASSDLEINNSVIVLSHPSFGHTYVAELTEGLITSFTDIDDPEYYYDSNGFGQSVAVRKIPSPIDDVTYVLIGAPFYDGLASNSGKVYLYSNASGQFEILKEFENDVQDEGDYLGYSVGLSQDAIIFGTPYTGNFGQGKVQIVNLLDAPVNVQATKGLSIDNDPTEATVSWDFQGNQNLLAGFNIYRDDEFLIYRDKATAINTAPNTISDNWNDNSGNAGQHYIYSVKSVNNNIPFESYGAAAEGYNSANGILRGAVTTQLGAVPVPGVTITATGIVNGEVYNYSTITLPNGEYTFNDIFYDANAANVTEYVIEAEFLDHIIIPQTTNTVVLNPLNDPTQGIVNFFDITAYVIKGYVRQPDVNCSIEGIKVTAIKNGLPLTGQEAITDANGNYSLVINPNEDNLQEIRVRIEQEITTDQITTQYNFIPDADTIFNNFINFPLISEVNFIDELTYDIALNVKNTCDDAISTGKWNVRVRTLDGCFDEVYQTSSNGDLVVSLIPLNYTMSIIGVDVPSTVNQQALDYFANFPISLNLLDTHRASIEDLTHAEIENLSARTFTFHKAPEIVVAGLDDLICNTETAILEQGFEYTLSFNISEIHNGAECSVTEGIIEVSNPASTDGGPVLVPYNSLLEKFDDYTFEASGPNQVFPHAFAVTFDYKTVDGNYLGRLTRAVFVEGSVSIPGTDVIVDPATGNDAVPYPLMVLRDPPGDQSSSYIAAGQEIAFESEMTIENSLDGALYTEISSEILGIGAELNASINGGYSKEQSIVLANSVTTSVQISTSDDEDNIGRGADIIVGTGLVMQFGQIKKFSVGGCDSIVIQNITGISPNAATTTWSYQISQIEDIIQGYQNDSLENEIGTLVIERNGEDLTQEQARVFLSSNINNWKEVIKYHDVKTVPYYVLCTQKPADGLSDSHKAQIGYWQAQIKPLFGTMTAGEFVLSKNIVWNQTLIDIYNSASAAIRNLQQNGDLNIWSFPYTGDQNTVNLNSPLGSFELVDFNAILADPDLVDYTSNFGDQVKNITTGGNIQIEESVENVSASTTSMSQSVYLGSELDISGTVGGGITVFGGVFAGLGAGVLFGVVEEIAALEVTIGVSVELETARSNSYSSDLENAVEVGYTIFDDDNIDQFSFAVIQGVAPNMTPYFDYFGGHSSCPPEEGSVFVDAPIMGIIDPESGGSASSSSKYNVPADEVATFIIRAENQTPVSSNPKRELKLFLESSSNPNGAIVKLNGVNLSDGEYVDTFFVNDPQDLTLTIEKGPTEFDYADIQIGFEPSCGEGPRTYVYASAYFVNPCSPVTLVAPNENWVINDDTTKLVVAMQDYDPENPFLVDATLQYRRLGTGDDWADVPSLELEQGNFIIPDTLVENNSSYAAGQIPKYFFIWTIPTTEGAYPDGDYEVRTKMACDNFTSTISNVIDGKIARDGLNLFGSPQPSDHLWTAGDEISFTFNNDLDCALMTQSFIDNNVSIINENTGQIEPFTLSCYANKVIFVMDNPMSDYDGQFLTMTVDNIPSIEGNISLPQDWTFRVITQKIYWADADTIKLRMYQDEVDQLTINLNNTTENETVSGLSFAALDGGFGDWLTIVDPATQPFSVNPSGRAISFDIDAAEAVGIYNETVNVLEVGDSGNTPQVHIQLEVLVKPPNWDVDPGDFDSSMNMIANWKYNSEPISAISKDDADLISVWVGNEIRAVASITQTGEFYASFLTIYGHVDDGPDTHLEFRIWDADTGIEYDGHAADSIFYAINSTRGTTANPEILNVDIEYDRAKYISLRQGWTGFSLVDSTSNMDVMHKLRSLNTVSEGDLIVTGDKFSKYTDLLGWFNFGSSNLSMIDNEEGYMIYLENGPDTLRVMGIESTTNDITLKSGWNWLGFPFENEEALNTVLNLNAANTTGSDRIKIDFPLPDQTAKFANYNISNDNWNDGNIANMEPNNLYKLYSGHPNGANLSWTPQNNAKDEKGESEVRSSSIADPNDASTWVMPDFDTDQVMPVIAEVIVSGVIANDPADMVALFENDTIRALGSIEYIEALMSFEISMLAEKSMSTYDIRYYDASEGVVLSATNILNFDINGVGNVLDPYEIIFEMDPCPEVLLLGPTAQPFLLDKTFDASIEIRVLGNLDIPAGVNIILNAPKVTIVDRLNTGLNSSIIVRPDGCN